MPYKDPVKRREYNRKYQRDYYKLHTKKMKASVRRRKLSIRQWMEALKRGLCCSECGISGEDNPWMIEFHHSDDYQKTDIISFLVSNGYGKKRILKEMSRCFPICANCHRKIHYEETRKHGHRGAGIKPGKGNPSYSAKAGRRANRRYREKRLEEGGDSSDEYE